MWLAASQIVRHVSGKVLTFSCSPCGVHFLKRGLALQAWWKDISENPPTATATAVAALRVTQFKRSPGVVGGGLAIRVCEKCYRSARRPALPIPPPPQELSLPPLVFSLPPHPRLSPEPFPAYNVNIYWKPCRNGRPGLSVCSHGYTRGLEPSAKSSPPRGPRHLPRCLSKLLWRWARAATTGPSRLPNFFGKYVLGIIGATRIK